MEAPVPAPQQDIDDSSSLEVLFSTNPRALPPTITDPAAYIPDPDEIVDFELTGENIQSILRRLQNIRRCVFDVPGSNPSCVYWSELPLVFSSTYVHFLSRQRSLRELRIANAFEVPLDVMLSLRTAAPTLRLNPVGVVQDSRDSEPTRHHLPSLRQLIWNRGAHGGLTYFEIQASDHTVRETSALSPMRRRLCFSSASKLSETCFLFSSALTAPSFLDAMIEVLASHSNPKLAKLTFVSRYGNPTLRGFPAVIKANAMSMFDAALAAHPANPCLKVRWNVNMERFNVVFDYAQHFYKFVRMVQQGMPSAQARGKLVVERVPLDAVSSSTNRSNTGEKSTEQYNS
ncbi:hypothetical protein C8R45DRAFT_1097124 [Mycena sanguinolenta]|nr:hypothetical protein C8R45DRAFT_1097124 [Mycena sanguinolenta]